MENSENEFPKFLQSKVDEVLDSFAKAKEKLGGLSGLDLDYVEVVVKREISNYKDETALIKKIAANASSSALTQTDEVLRQRMEGMVAKMNALIGIVHDGFVKKMEYLKMACDKLHVE